MGNARGEGRVKVWAALAIAGATGVAWAAPTTPTTRPTVVTPARTIPAPSSKPSTSAAPTTSSAPTTAPTTSTAPTGSAAPTAAPTGKPDLRCTVIALDNGGTPAANPTVPKPTIEANVHSLGYRVTVFNDGGPTGAAVMVRYDYVQKVGGTTNVSTKPPVPFGPLAAGQSLSVGPLTMSASAPYPSTHQVTVTVDVDGQIAESNEANNTCSLTMQLY